MLRSMRDLNDYAIHATDGNIGRVTDFYFDDEAWTIRYLVVDTGTWLASRKVLISPIAIGKANWTEKILPVALTKKQVQDSPPIDTNKPVSRQHEIEYLRYFGYPFYWGGLGLWGTDAFPGMMMPDYDGSVLPPQAEHIDREVAYAHTGAEEQRNNDRHLRSCDAVIGYHIMAADGAIGHVEGVLVDDESWAIRYLAVETSNWGLSHDVLIAPQWIENISWPDATVSVNLTQQAVKDAPPYDSTVQLIREGEMGIYKHYGRAPYWLTDD